MTQELAPTFTAYREITFVVYGMLLWDYLITLWLEFHFVTGKLGLRWPLIPYFLTRYSALGFVISCILFQTSKLPLNCDALYLGGNLLGKVAVTSASINVLVRTVIIWRYQWFIILSLGLFVSGEVVLICTAFQNREIYASWNEELQVCAVSPGSERNNLGFFAPYALCVDCIIVALTIIGLRKYDRKSGFAGILTRQGLSFFLLVLTFQTFVTVAVYCTENAVFVSTSSVLCAMIVPMVSCHMVRSILSGSSSNSKSCAASRGNSTTDEGYCRRDGVQLTTHVELGSSSSE